jgi:hypothetical protein
VLVELGSNAATVLKSDILFPSFSSFHSDQHVNASSLTPLVVRQWDVLIAVNYPARAFGITRMNNWRDTLKKCPKLIVVHVATYKEGDNAPGYWDNPNMATHWHKVRPCSESPWSSPSIVDTIIAGALNPRDAVTFVSDCTNCRLTCTGLSRLLLLQEREDHRNIQRMPARQ